MEVGHESGRAAFLAALADFLDAAGGLADVQFLAASRCLGWTVGDVIVHVHLGLQEMLLATAGPPASQPPDRDAASYWHEFPGGEPGGGDLGHVRFVRLMSAAYQRPAGLVAHLRQTADGLRAAVAGLAPGTVAFQGHVLATGDYLAVWAVELAVHHLDLARELTLAPPAPAAARLARATVEALAGGTFPASWPDETVILAGTGRVPLDDRQRREAGPPSGALPVLG